MEELATAASADGAGWKEVPAVLARLLTSCGRRWPELVHEPGASLADLLNTVLHEALAAGELDDDASVAAVLARPARRESRG